MPGLPVEANKGHLGTSLLFSPQLPALLKLSYSFQPLQVKTIYTISLQNSKQNVRDYTAQRAG